MSTTQPDDDLPQAVRTSWHRFAETYEPLRSELYRYCRYLTRSPWDAEDLVQDALAMFGSERLADAARRGGIEARFVQGALPSPPRAEVRVHRGEAIVLLWYAHDDGEAVRAIDRFETEGDRIARLDNYFFTPDVIAEVCAELTVPFKSNGHRWWLTGGGTRAC